MRVYILKVVLFIPSSLLFLGRTLRRTHLSKPIVYHAGVDRRHGKTGVLAVEVNGQKALLAKEA